jgi:hypothetical protein
MYGYGAKLNLCGLKFHTYEVRCMNYFEVDITQTAKPVGKSHDTYGIWNREQKQFKTLPEVKAYLQERYGDCKRSRIYHDVEDQAEHIGYVYCYKDRFYGQESKLWFCQDWIEVAEVRSRIIIV